MSNINTSTSSAPAPSVTTTPVNKGPSFDPVKAQRQRQEGPVIDPFTEALKEATDGDSSEADMRSALGLVDDDKKSKSSSDDDILDKVRGAAGARMPGDATNSNDGTSTADAANRARQQALQSDTAQGESTSSVTNVEMATINLASRHEDLMLFASSMEPQEAATHIAQEAANSVEALQNGEMWTRDTDRSDNLIATQMTANA